MSGKELDMFASWFSTSWHDNQVHSCIPISICIPDMFFTHASISISLLLNKCAHAGPVTRINDAFMIL